MYSGCNVLPSLDYKREGKGRRLGSRFLEDGVMEKTVPRRNLRIVRMNRPLHTVDVNILGSTHLFTIRNRSPDVNILGSTHLLARPSKRISVPSMTLMYLGCNVLPSLDYKREGKGRRLGSCFVEDGVVEKTVPRRNLRIVHMN